MSTKGSATNLFKKGLNCTQSMLMAYGTGLGLDEKTALRIATAFGGGMGKTGETCGAVTGAFMLIGLKHGTTHRKDKGSKKKTYKLVEEFIEKFKKRNGTIQCRELIGGSFNTPGIGKIIREKCPKYVNDAADIIEYMLELRDGKPQAVRSRLSIFKKRAE